MRSLLKKTPFEAKRFDFNEVVGDAVDFLSAFAVGRKVDLEKRPHRTHSRSSAIAFNFSRS
jgi:hypothetical protein